MQVFGKAELSIASLLFCSYSILHIPDSTQTRSALKSRCPDSGDRQPSLSIAPAMHSYAQALLGSEFEYQTETVNIPAIRTGRLISLYCFGFPISKRSTTGGTRNKRYRPEPVPYEGLGRAVRLFDPTD